MHLLKYSPDKEKFNILERVLTMKRHQMLIRFTYKLYYVIIHISKILIYLLGGKMSYRFIDLAIEVLNSEKREMTIKEIWEVGKSKGLEKNLIL